MDTYVTESSFDKEGFCYFKEKKIKHIVIGALPSEEVTTLYLGRSGRETYSVVDSILKKHPKRIEAPCQDVPRCGGCVFQSLDYKAQLAHKQQMVVELFPRFTSCIRPIIASPKTFGYRGKMDFSFSQDKQGNKYLGLTQAKGAGRVMATKYCHLAPKWMNDLLKLFQDDFSKSDLCAYDRKGEGDLKCLIMREGHNTQEKMVVLEVVAHPKSHLKKEHIEFFKKRVLDFDPAISFYLRVVQIMKGVPTQHYEMHLLGPEAIHETLTIGQKQLKFKISPSAFFQPNPYSAEILFQTIFDIVKTLNIQTCCDLFCGTGTIGMAISSLVKSCVGVEINPYAIFDAKANAELNQIEHLSFFADDAAKFIASNNQVFDLTIVDPPRAGLGQKACELVTNLGSKFVLYVSCNPKTQALDLEILESKNYEVLMIQPLDQFPHTNHVENIILLQKTDGL